MGDGYEQLRLARRRQTGASIPNRVESPTRWLERSRNHMHNCQINKSNIEAQILEENVRVRRIEYDLSQYAFKPRGNDFLQTRIEKINYFRERIARQHQILAVLEERLQEASRRLDHASTRFSQEQQRVESARAQSLEPSTQERDGYTYISRPSERRIHEWN